MRSPRQRTPTAFELQHAVATSPYAAQRTKPLRPRLRPRAQATALSREIESDATSKRVLVFCNTIESCRRVENLLKRRDPRGAAYEVHAFHGAIPAAQRKATLAAFTAERPPAGGVPRLLVCTDRASRGMDFDEVGADPAGRPRARHWGAPRARGASG